jgi:hypothetical protein
VNHNLESQKLQYAMQERLCGLGFQDIEVIDEDLGCSAAGTVTRSGFERMVAQVCMGHIAPFRLSFRSRSGTGLHAGQASPSPFLVNVLSSHLSVFYRRYHSKNWLVVWAL